VILVGGMLEGSHRKRCKSRLFFSSKKQLEKLKMFRRLQKANGIEISSTIQTLSYEDHGVEVGNFQFGDSLTQNSEGTNIAKFDNVDESKDGQQSSVFESKTLLRSSVLISPSIYCCK